VPTQGRVNQGINKCHTRPPTTACPHCPPLYDVQSRDRRRGSDIVRNFCEQKQSLDECNSAIYPGNQAPIIRGGIDGMPGVCAWQPSVSGLAAAPEGSDDVINHPHQDVELLICSNTESHGIRYCNSPRFHGDSSESLYMNHLPSQRVNIPSIYTNNPYINRSTIINDPQTTIKGRPLIDAPISDFTKIEIIRGADAREENPGHDNYIRGLRDYYFSILITGSDDDTDIGKIYQYNCSQPAPRFSDERAWANRYNLNNNCPTRDLYNNIINTEGVVSFGELNNENYKYGIVLNW